MKKGLPYIALSVCLLLITYKFCGLISKSLNSSSFVIKDGEGLSKVAFNLEKSGLVVNGTLFKIYSKFWILFNDCDIIQRGEYYINKNENFNTILYKFCNGKTETKSLTIPEGLETREVLKLINDCEYLSGENVIANDEGIIFPDTYHFSNQIEKKVLFKKMQDQLTLYINKFWDDRIRNDFIRTKRDLVILASIVEKEAKTDEERPIIASVYLNRLAKNMYLGADPTTIYEITKGKYKMNRLLTINDLKITGSYNTYRKKGLPAGPICNPGVNSILAVLYPAETDYLYFVAKADLSGHVFSKTYKEHLKNIKQIKEERKKRKSEKQQ